jgi:hypothetical protein
MWHSCGRAPAPPHDDKLSANVALNTEQIWKPAGLADPRCLISTRTCIWIER